MWNVLLTFPTEAAPPRFVPLACSSSPRWWRLSAVVKQHHYSHHNLSQHKFIHHYIWSKLLRLFLAAWIKGCNSPYEEIKLLMKEDILSERVALKVDRPVQQARGRRSWAFSQWEFALFLDLPLCKLDHHQYCSTGLMKVSCWNSCGFLQGELPLTWCWLETWSAETWDWLSLSAILTSFSLPDVSSTWGDGWLLPLCNLSIFCIVLFLL